MDLIARFLRTSARMNTLLGKILHEYVDGQARDSVERVRAAKNFAARITRERKNLADEMKSAWRDTNVDIPSGQIGVPSRPGDGDE